MGQQESFDLLCIAGILSNVSLAYSQESSLKSNVDERKIKKENELDACSSAGCFAWTSFKVSLSG
jgi:hypothetical protein